MTLFFRKDPNVTTLFIGGCGRVTSKTILKGEKYLKYVGKGLIAVDGSSLEDKLSEDSEGTEVFVLNSMAESDIEAIAPVVDVKVEESEMPDIMIDAVPVVEEAPKKKGGRPKKEVTE